MLFSQVSSEIVLRRSILWCNANNIDSNFAYIANFRLLSRLNTCSKFTRIILLLLLSLLTLFHLKINSAPSLFMLPDKWLSANLSAIFLETNGKAS